MSDDIIGTSNNKSKLNELEKIESRCLTRKISDKPLTKNNEYSKIAMTTVKANPYQPRKTFDEER